MLTITINGEEKHLRNNITELTIPEFEAVCAATTMKDADYIDRYISIFRAIGLTDEDIDSIDPNEFIELTRKFNLTTWENMEFKKEFTIGDKTYRAFNGEKYVLSVRDLAKIEKAIKQNQQYYLGEMLAIIYKDISLGKDMHYNDEHIKAKAQLFRDSLTANIVLPYVSLILNDVIMKLNDGPTK